MIHFRRVFRAVFVVCVTIVLVACQNEEEQAAAHFERAQALLAEGDFARARVEFRNVFALDGNNREARLLYAATLRARGQLDESYGQFLRVVEQFPDDVEGRIALAEMAIGLGNLEEAERHGTSAIALAPEDPRIPPIALSLDYAATLEEEDAPARRAIIDRIGQMTAATPEGTLLLQQLVINNSVLDGDVAGALAAVDAALMINPRDRYLLDLRLSALAELDRLDEVEAHLLVMIGHYPEDQELVGTLLRFYLSQGEVEAAGDFLRRSAEATTDPEQRNAFLVALVQLRLETAGGALALAEIDQLMSDPATRSLPINLVRASIRFELGEADAAMAELEALLDADPAPADVARIRVMLARMLQRQDNTVGARSQIEQALEADPANVDALIIQAAWLIPEDETDRAIALLRTAVDIRPGDVEALTLMAQAHARNGDRELGQEFLLLAVDASNAAPEPTLRYVGQLMAQDRLLSAEDRLIAALRLAPDHPELLTTLGQLYIQMEDWPRAEQVERSLRANGDSELIRQADAIQTARLAGQDRLSEAVDLIENLATESGLADTRAQIAVIRARLANGDVQGALEFAEQLVDDAPENMTYRYSLATVQNAVGNLAGAETSYRTLLEMDTAQPQAWLSLVRLYNRQGRTEAMAATLDQALAAFPDSLDLLWAKASLQEANGDIEGAIEVYEAMYARDPDAPVIANNLASLLATYREDEDSLNRAWSVARRLRGIEVAPFQDTYGWISYRMGDLNAALSHLEPAAAGLPEDALVQYHLGMTYLGLERQAEALAQLRRALELAGSADPRPQFDTARAALAELEAALAEAEN